MINLNTIAMIRSSSTSWESKEFGLAHEQQKSGSRTGTGTWLLARSCQIRQIKGQTHWHWPNGLPINCWYGVSHFWCILPERIITYWSQVCYQWFAFALLKLHTNRITKSYKSVSWGCISVTLWLRMPHKNNDDMYEPQRPYIGGIICR